MVTALQQELFPEALRQTFTAGNLPLGSSVTLTELETDRRWLAVDNHSQRYVLYLADPNNDGTADALQIMRPHDLVGQRGFSFLVTGTVTVLEDNRSLTLQAVDDVIVRGNLNLPGDGSDLVLQSDKWVYWEGTGTIGGDLTIAGGMELDGTSHNGAGAGNASVLIPAISRLVTPRAGSVIDIRGAQDVDILGTIVAGGTIGDSGVIWSGPDSQVRLQAGQQLFIDAAVLAAGQVRAAGGTAGSDDDGVAVMITSAAGLTAAGLTSTSTGSLVEILGVGSLQLMGNIVSGGILTQQFNSAGQRIGESIAWSGKPSEIRVLFDEGQAWIGGLARAASGNRSKPEAISGPASGSKSGAVHRSMASA
ncbi:MAG UNVERIFIED_CONTAM: hypothetical protein LVR18_14315 [Planctomycetaceae bacterium]